jgi:DNA polymerase IIIc chi subunit
MVEVVGADEIELGRERFRFYRDRGYPMSPTHDVAAPEGR